MPNYHRPSIPGATYFITQITDQCQPWLYRDLARHALRTALTKVRLWVSPGKMELEANRYDDG